MKKICAFLLFFVVVLSSLTSCFDAPPSDTGTKTDTETQSDTDSEKSDTDTDAETDTTKFKEDTIDYSVLYDEKYPSSLIYGYYRLDCPSFTPYYHGYKAALSMTFDDGYDTDSAKYISKTLGKYGYTGTAMISPCFLEGNALTISNWKKILKDGVLDVGVHGYAHINPQEITDVKVYEKETKEAQEYLKSLFPEQNIITFATPFAHITDEYKEYLKKYFISNREEAGGVTPVFPNDYDKYNIKSVSARKDTTTAALNKKIKIAVEKGAWLVELFHCVLDNPSNSTDAPKALFEAHLSYIDKNYGDKLWVASFEKVSIYKEQLEHSELKYVSCDKESMTFRLTSDLDKDIYNIPMTMKINLPTFADSAYAVINGSEYDLKIEVQNGKKYATVLDCPFDTDIKIYMGGNYLCFNDCTHSYDIIDTVYPSCTERGYTRITCSVCKNSYCSKYLSIVEHNFGEWKISEDGENRTRICLVCNAEETEALNLKNVALDAHVEGSEPKNEWVPVSLVNDGSYMNFYQSGVEQGTYVILTLDSAKYIKDITVTVGNYQHSSLSWTDKNQTFTVSVYRNGAWSDIGTFENNSVTSSKKTLDVNFDVRLEGVEKIEISYSAECFGATNIYEITANGF